MQMICWYIRRKGGGAGGGGGWRSVFSSAKYFLTLSARFLSLKMIFAGFSPSFLTCCCGMPAQRDYKKEKRSLWTPFAISDFSQVGKYLFNTTCTTENTTNNSIFWSSYKLHTNLHKRLEEQHTGIVAVMSSNPIGASEFFLGFLCNCLSCFAAAKITFTCVCNTIVPAVHSPSLQPASILMA